MAEVKEHYDAVLSEIYTWLYGGYSTGIKKSMDFFKQNSIEPVGSGIAIDLGSGSGFQSIPLAKLGFSVSAIDLNKYLLDELHVNKGDLNIKLINDDLLNFQKYCESNVELIICMTDTLIHLESKEKIIDLFEKSFDSLESNGRLILTFRDMTDELIDLDRFIPVRSDESTIFTCFLEYEKQFVKVYDIVYIKKDSEWELKKSYYRKLRISKKWIEEKLLNIGFNLETSIIDKGNIEIIARKKIN